MQAALVNPKITEKNIFTMADYRRLRNVHEFILYGDNILEGITLLNTLTLHDGILEFYGVIYEPIDQPIYLFKDGEENIYSIKICGAFEKWNLPKQVNRIRQFVDLPDYILYSIYSKKVILAGENTETASVGNSQWQREGRKLGAARNNVPFIYQTFYSGKDESQQTVREPTSLQVYNQLVYSIRYKTPSFVAYFENNFDGSKTRIRKPEDSQDLFARYIKSVLLNDVNPAQNKVKRELEAEFFAHMLSYLKEGKYSGRRGIENTPRLQRDFVVINPAVEDGIIKHTDDFVSSLLKYIYDDNKDFIKKYPIDSLVAANFVNWTAYSNKKYISDLLKFLENHGQIAQSYMQGQAKIGFANTELCKSFMCEKFPNSIKDISRILNPDVSKTTLVMPLRIHKVSNGQLTFSPDPESGEIVAFCELFGYTAKKEKKHPVIGYVTVDAGDKFNIDDKQGTKLYKALAEYVDILIINNSQVVTKFNKEIHDTDFVPESISEVRPTGKTEEMAIVATYLTQTTIKDNWTLCFIHTHHSSWQQLVIHNDGVDVQHKIDRVSTKVDLITQYPDKNNNLFMVAEGKNNYQDLLRDKKIRTAMEKAGEQIKKLCKLNHTKFDAFIYNLNTVPDKDPEYYAKQEARTVAGAIKLGHFDDIAFESNFVVIIVYNNVHGKTAFKLVYSPDFDEKIKTKLDLEFEQ